MFFLFVVSEGSSMNDVVSHQLVSLFTFLSVSTTASRGKSATEFNRKRTHALLRLVQCQLMIIHEKLYVYILAFYFLNVLIFSFFFSLYNGRSSC